jgi:hypothetical protein
METKTFLKSKTLWVNLICISAMILQAKTGFVIPPEDQATLLSIINLVLRMITNKPLSWS